MLHATLYATLYTGKPRVNLVFKHTIFSLWSGRGRGEDQPAAAVLLSSNLVLPPTTVARGAYTLYAPIKHASEQGHTHTPPYHPP